MASGRDRFHERRQSVASLGKVLTRRAGSVCELCAEGSDLRPSEVSPVPESPDVNSAVLLCSRCRGLHEGSKLPGDFDGLRFLVRVVWSDTLPVQLAAVRLLRRVAAREQDWAKECLEGLWLPEEVEELLDA